MCSANSPGPQDASRTAGSPSNSPTPPGVDTRRSPGNCSAPTPCGGRPRPGLGAGGAVRRRATPPEAIRKGQTYSAPFPETLHPARLVDRQGVPATPAVLARHCVEGGWRRRSPLYCAGGRLRRARLRWTSRYPTRPAWLRRSDQRITAGCGIEPRRHGLAVTPTACPLPCCRQDRRTCCRAVIPPGADWI